ncbi:uncharacterized protein CELE_Y17D7B.4 [Caenorhabditis elegans]|uniref:Uncharacterized protein n=1 Tax=Caenorhabditis elegans TaxID=6239 RepID=O62404_CAEEL|nr:Uncharacterized protein CELE_Y17D7B.4 [Caenorhabditis elegans]CAA16301.1 Uncharacterized protein CELE_Y17D7B.4 [Caenorhabditis elegans]|eukprot:NP_507668.1 Uncharacterized protein CELE_Y17D7B.4 [Caenorhabditis elegans]
MQSSTEKELLTNASLTVSSDFASNLEGALPSQPITQANPRAEQTLMTTYMSSTTNQADPKTFEEQFVNLLGTFTPSQAVCNVSNVDCGTYVRGPETWSSCKLGTQAIAPNASYIQIRVQDKHSTMDRMNWKGPIEDTSPLMKSLTANFL